MPEGDGGVGSGEVASRLKKALSSLGPTRANLIHKGLVYAPDHGVVAFTARVEAHRVAGSEVITITVNGEPVAETAARTGGGPQASDAVIDLVSPCWLLP